MRCPLCNAPNEAPSRFCGDCGSPLPSAATTPLLAASDPLASGGPPPADAPPVTRLLAPDAQEPPLGGPVSAERRRVLRGRLRPWWMAAAGMALAAAVAVAVPLGIHWGEQGVLGRQSAAKAASATWVPSGQGVLAAPADWETAVPVGSGDDLAVVQASPSGYALTLYAWRGRGLKALNRATRPGRVIAVASGAGASGAGEVAVLTTRHFDLFTTPSLHAQGFPNPGIRAQGLLFGDFQGNGRQQLLGVAAQSAPAFTGYVLFRLGSTGLVARNSVPARSPLAPLFPGPSVSGVTLALYNWFDTGQQLSGISLLRWNTTKGLTAVTTLPLPFEEDRTVSALRLQSGPGVAVTGEGANGALVSLYTLRNGQLVPAGAFASPFGGVPPLVVGGRFGGRNALLLFDHVTRERYVRMVPRT